MNAWDHLSKYLWVTVRSKCMFSFNLGKNCQIVLSKKVVSVYTSTIYVFMFISNSLTKSIINCCIQRPVYKRKSCFSCAVRFSYYWSIFSITFNSIVFLQWIGYFSVGLLVLLICKSLFTNTLLFQMLLLTFCISHIIFPVCHFIQTLYKPYFPI